ASFSANQTQICQGQSVLFSDLTTSNVPVITYQWDFGDGGTAFVKNPQHIYSVPGSYDVTLKVLNANGCEDSTLIPITITVGAPPNALISPSINQGCAPLTVMFTDSSTGPFPVTSWNWTFGNGNTSTQQAPTATFTIPGSYAVKIVIVDGNGCTDSTTSLITVADAPVVDFMVSATQGCAPLTVQFTDLTTSTSPLQTWFWDFGDGNTSTVQNPIHTYLFNGDYDVSLTVTDINNCSNTLLMPDLIHLANPMGSFTSNATPSCPPLGVTFNASAVSDTTITNWFWDFGDGNTGLGQNPTHIYTTPGNYAVTLIITNAFGCSDTVINPQHVTIFTAPTASFTVSDSFFCAPQSVLFSGTSTPGSNPIATYFYDFGNGATSNNINSTQFFNTPGSYTVSLVVTDLGGCADTATKTIFANPPIQADFNVSANIGCASTPISFLDNSSGPNPAVIWNWDFGDGNTSNAQFPVHTYGQVGTYSVSLYVEDQNGCSDSVVKPALISLTGPVADFIPDSAKACPGENILFTDTSTPDTTIISWFWDFGDGNTSEDINPTHRYVRSGKYTVVLSAINGKKIRKTEQM
ncbi:MAG: PKD domain-containing protein, partial [Bacteroidetes bacterium]|nr:PKD domain-containing protein [Bacteroidota bacterium]